MCILSIQSHVAYGYVGNKAAVYPLQSMGYDVWPVHTVQFSNHTGYGKWQGEIFSAQQVLNVVRGIEDLGLVPQCKAILSGYMGSREICDAVADIAKRFKAANPDLVYLCDPVIGNTNCFVKPEVLDFFKAHLVADIITPNHFEAEELSGLKIADVNTLRAAMNSFHDRGIGIVVITGLKLSDRPDTLCVAVSDGKSLRLVQTREFAFAVPVNGTGDLFSALFLGGYLTHKDVGLALQQVVHFMHKVLQNTFDAKTRELQVLSERYDLSAIGSLPELIDLSPGSLF